MSSMIYGTVVLAALLSKVAAFPNLYDSVRMGCTIPEMAFGGHQAPTPNEMITIDVANDAGESVTEFVPGNTYTVTVPAYTGTVNMWIHSNAGTLMGADIATHPQAAACEQASFSSSPGAEHIFEWTAPETSDTCTISVAQATGAGDAYNTATMDLPGGAAAPGAAADAPDADDDELIEEEGDAEEADGAFAVATGAFAAAVTAVAALAM